MICKIEDIAELTDKGCRAYYGMLPSLIKDRGYKSGIEIGVLFGGHSEAMLKNQCLQFLVGIDPYRLYEQPIYGLETQEDFDLVYSYAMRRLDTSRYWHLRMTSDEAYPKLKNIGYLFDFVFIDGLHTYDQVKKDLYNYGSLIRKGGVIACHDYAHPNFPLLTTAIDEFAIEHSEIVRLGEQHAIYINKTW